MKPNAIKELVGKYKFASACALGVLLLVAGGVYRSGVREETEQSLQDRTAEADRLQANISNAASLKEQTEALAAINQTIQSRLVSPGKLGENLQYFYKIESSTEAKSIDIKQTYSAARAGKSQLVPVPYALSLQGEYKTAMLFLRRVEKGEHIARVVSANFSLGNDTASSVVSVSANIELLGTP